jgi:nucleoside-diphosphate kinase
MTQSTLILLKPDAIERGLTGVILERFERAGLRVTNCRFFRPSLAMLETHYDDLRTRNPHAFGRSTQYLADKTFIALVLTGPQAIQKARSLAGATDPCAAAAGTIRGDLGHDSIGQAGAENRATHNLIHAADSPESAARETALWFPATKE